MRILVVEDQAIVAEDLAATIESFGHEVDTAGTPQRALAAVVAAPPDVVFMDVHLAAGADGIDTAVQIRHLYPATRFIFLTAYTDPETRQRAEALDPAAYLPKPFDPAGVEAALKALGEPADAGLAEDGGGSS